MEEEKKGRVISFWLPWNVKQELDEAKRLHFYNTTQSKMLIALIQKGLEGFKREGDEQEEKDASLHYERD